MIKKFSIIYDGNNTCIIHVGEYNLNLEKQSRFALVYDIENEQEIIEMLTMLLKKIKENYE